MKRILMVFVSLIFIICLISCNEEEKVEEINIKFVIEENIYDIKKEVNYIVNIDDIPNISEEDIEGIYYDKEYTKEYNGEIIQDDIVLYVKTLEEKVLFEVVIKFNNVDYILEYEKNEIVNCEDILLDGHWEIRGLYYDSEFINKYNGEKVFENLILYIDAVEMIDVIFIIDGKENIVPIEKNTKITRNCVPIDDEYSVIELYFDSGYSQRYYDQVLSSDTMIFVKTIKETLIESGEKFSGPSLSTSIYSVFNLVDDGTGVIFNSIEEFNNYKNENNINEVEGNNSNGTITLSEYFEQLFLQDKSIIMIPEYSEHGYLLDFINITREDNVLYVNVKTKETYFTPLNEVVPTTRFYIYICDQSEIAGIDAVLLRDIRIEFNYKIIKVDMTIKDVNENIVSWEEND